MNRQPSYLSIENEVLRNRLREAKELVRQLAKEMNEAGVAVLTLDRLVELLKK